LVGGFGTGKMNTCDRLGTGKMNTCDRLGTGKRNTCHRLGTSKMNTCHRLPTDFLFVFHVITKYIPINSINRLNLKAEFAFCKVESKSLYVIW
jgi:hypothetical protein